MYIPKIIIPEQKLASRIKKKNDAFAPKFWLPSFLKFFPGMIFIITKKVFSHLKVKAIFEQFFYSLVFCSGKVFLI